MAINLNILREQLENPDLSLLEQALLDSIEGNCDIQIINKFQGGSVTIDKDIYFTEPLTRNNIKLYRQDIIWAELVDLYEIAGWTLTGGTTPTGHIMTFTPIEEE